MSHIVVATAGHIDHGKTALVRALTGHETDTLKEEVARKITIDLGFAFLSDNTTIIDVPGHEKFIKNMVTGVATVDFVLLVIAADDGIMPQTHEHLDILTLLGVKKGIVALTKIDLVHDDEWLELVELDITDLLEKQGFEIELIHRINNLTGDGVNELKTNIISMANQFSTVSLSSQFRMNVDRVFSKTGFGTVATGTVQNGLAKNGDEIEILPSGIKTKIRGIQTHGGLTDSVKSGDRAAINLANVKSINLTRGTVLATPGCLQKTNRILANISMTSSTNWIIKNNQRLRFHIGTAEVLGRASGGRLEQSQSGNLIIDLESPVSVVMDDRFVIRSYSPMETIAGGVILDPFPVLKWKVLRDRIDSIPVEPQKRFEYLINEDWKKPKTKNEWQSLFFISKTKIDKWTDKLKCYETQNGLIYTDSGLKKAENEIISFFNISYEKNSFRSVLSSDGILTQVKWSDNWLIFVLKTMIGKGTLSEEKGGFSLSGYQPKFSQKDLIDLEKIESIVNQSGYEPILLKEIISTSGFNPKRVGDLIHLLFAQGKVENLGNQFWLNRPNLDNVLSDISNYFRSKDELTVADFKNITGLSRKTAIPLLEYLDKNHFTVRHENVRVKGETLNG